MVVTGGGRGIGAAVAERAAGEGYAVCVNYSRSSERAAALVQRIKAEGGTALAVKADLSVEDDIVELFRVVDRELGPPSVLVNNAGIDLERAIIDISSDDVERLFRVNVAAMMLCSREALRRMVRSAGGQGGTIVNIGSTASRTGGMPQDAVYTASKGAVEAFTLAMAKEVGREGVRACCIRPGIIETEIFSAPGQLDQVREVAGETVPLGRTGTPEEVAAAVLWLCSPAAAYVNGHPIDVAGGR